MRFANIRFDGNRTGSVNIGDDLQLIAIEELYKYGGIDYADVVRIGLSELTSYDGEYLILPISFPLYGYRDGMNITMFSPKIIPVFLALSIMADNLSKEECEYLRRYEPIGCRDYYTMKILRKYGIWAYFNGCMTATLPRADKLSGERPYLVDIPQEYMRWIPEEIRDNAVVRTQVLNECFDPEQEMKKRLEEYAENASLIVTTRLHCAMPCVAMGLPVVMMKSRFSFRFSFLSRYLHVYEENEFDSIDWHPTPIYYEETKNKIKQIAYERLMEAKNKYSSFCDLSYFYEKDNIREDYYMEHVDNVKEYIQDNVSKNVEFEYGIWGITQKSDMICSYLEKNYPKAKLSFVYDRARKVVFHGVESTDDMDVLSKIEVFVLEL